MSPNINFFDHRSITGQDLYPAHRNVNCTYLKLNLAQIGDTCMCSFFSHLRTWSRHEKQHAVANLIKLNYSNFKPAMTHKDRTRNFENNLRISCMHFHNNTSPEALILFAL